MTGMPEGNAIVYCQGAYNTTNGKTAHGLVRRTARYNVLGVIDSRYAGQDAGMVLDGKNSAIPIYPDLRTALEDCKHMGVQYLVVGLAPDGGRLPPHAREDVKLALEMGLNVDSGLHDYLSDDEEMVDAASHTGARIRDVRKPLPAKELHFFTGKIEEVKCLKVAILGTDSAVGKRTTAWVLVDALRARGYKAELVGTGQTAWMQGARHAIIMDSLLNDFVSGEIEHAVWSTWKEAEPHVIILEGQGSLMNPAYPGGFEILAAGRPDVVVMQHAPARLEYDGFPGYPLHPIETQIRAVELIGGKPVVAITINHEGLEGDGIKKAADDAAMRTGLPAADVLVQGPEEIVKVLEKHIKR
ncbi:MAG: DUF1611 domain-containing protein [Candidatus Thermoplasmatota archaeon]|nr:DUF1611 domain-containing protein [Candidatus Thermoplasmatota archaeon]